MLEITNTKVYDLEECVVASGNSMRTSPVQYNDEEFQKGLERCKKLCKHGGGSGHTNFRTGIRVSFDMKYTQYITKQFQRYHWFDYVNSSSLMHRITKMDFTKCCNKYVSKATIRQMQTLINFYNMLEMHKTDEWEEVFNDVLKDYEIFVESEYGKDDLPKSIYKSDYIYDCYMRIISNCPMGAELFVRISTNYEELATMYKQRRNHKLKEDWGVFCKWVEGLPYAKELIICG